MVEAKGKSERKPEDSDATFGVKCLQEYRRLAKLKEVKANQVMLKKLAKNVQNTRDLIIDWKVISSEVVTDKVTVSR
ncbi:hypothetical protein HC931_25640 [Candidatus Gracilibacteria bacterium]|nr:hypothetical protein [Candidatus Gracilibacteria bacterium]